MSDPNRPDLASAFQNVQRRLVQSLDYARAVLPIAADDPKLLAELSDSVIVLVAARLEGFFKSAVGLGTRHREQVLRKHFADHGFEQALTCDLPKLVKLAHRRVSFEAGGKRLDNLFHLMFKCSVWPDDDTRDLVLDLVLLRNLIVHNSGRDWSQDGAVPAAYASQFRRADVLDTRRYGNFAAYSVDHLKALRFVRESTLAIVEQLKYLEQRLVHETGWSQSDN